MPDHSQEDAAHASPQDIFVVPEWWAQPVAYFAGGSGSARLGHYNDEWCNNPSCQHHDEKLPAFLCDFCPRIFHESCLAVCPPAAESNEPWKCPECAERDLVRPS